MKRYFRNLSAVAACMLVLAGTLSCGADSSGLIILGHIALDDECTCVAPTGSTAIYQSRGSLDPTLEFFNTGRLEYIACVGLENRLFNQEVFTEDNSTTKGLEHNTRDIVPDVAEIELIAAEGSEFSGGIPAYRVNLPTRPVMSRRVKGVDIQDRAAMTFPLIPPQVTEQLLNHPQLSPDAPLRIVARYRILAHTQDGAQVESDYFDYTIEVCRNCMNLFPQGDINNCPIGSVLTSPGAEAGATICLPGQDSTAVSCDCPEGEAERDGACEVVEAGGGG